MKNRKAYSSKFRTISGAWMRTFNAEKQNWRKYGFEFLSIFIAVISAFALNSWNEARKNRSAEDSILTEIYYGLEKDLKDIESNMSGHERGNEAVQYFRELIAQQPVSDDSLVQIYFNLTRDFISIQNTSGYETLKSRGLEIIENDSLRSQIISLYEYDYTILQKLEEEYFEMQFQENYYKEINQIVSKSFLFDAQKNLVGIQVPLDMAENEEKILLSYLLKIQINRYFILQFYPEVKANVEKLMAAIKANQAQ